MLDAGVISSTKREEKLFGDKFLISGQIAVCNLCLTVIIIML